MQSTIVLQNAPGLQINTHNWESITIMAAHNRMAVKNGMAVQLQWQYTIQQTREDPW